jgi:hypothetical protein
MTQAPYPPPPGYPMPGHSTQPQGYPGPAVQVAPAPSPQVAGLPPLPPGWEYGPGNLPRPMQAAAPVATAAPPTPPAAAAYDSSGFPGQAVSNLGAAIADATLGVARLPRLLIGDYVLQIEITKKPERSIALVAEMLIESSTNPERPPGMRVSWYQNLAGPSPDALAAQQGAALAFILRASGFANREAAADAGWSAGALIAHINACVTSPGPLTGRRVRCTVSDSGKLTKRGQTILNYAWVPA